MTTRRFVNRADAVVAALMTKHRTVGRG